LGTDFPYPWTTTSVDHVLNTAGLKDEDKVAILGANAVKLFGIKG
jgi:aminocarboxymuconate-semialdehyde decarboxylase